MPTEKAKKFLEGWERIEKTRQAKQELIKQIRDDLLAYTYPDGSLVDGTYDVIEDIAFALADLGYHK